MAPSLYRRFDLWLGRLGRSPSMSARNFQYCCAASGVLCSLTFLFTFVACGFLPPAKAYWTAEETVAHYKSHLRGIHTGAAIMCLSGAFYLPLTAGISAQMRRIPNLHYSVSALQLASGASGIFTFMMPSLILSTTAFRLERPIEITQALNELFWITALMPWPTFMAQNFAFAYAILVDPREKTLFPKWMALVNIAAPIAFVPGIALHTTKSGPIAWHGAFPFWVAGSVFCVQLVVESVCLAMAVSSEQPGGEMIMDLFPSGRVLEKEKEQERHASEQSVVHQV